ncbi:MAG: hypothetical protein ACLGSD_17060 [Acidobacteriota bacterium]
MKLRTFVPLIVILSMVLPATSKGEQLSVEQLKEIVSRPDPLPAGFKNGGAPVALLQDATMAHRLDTLELSQRLTRATLDSILKAHAFGPQTVRALTVLSYRSELLDPPPDELPNRPAPDAAEQQRMLLAASAYVFKTLTHLPDFFATRTTTEYYGVPPELNETGLPVQVGLHPRGSSSHEITFRGGKEVIDPMASSRAPATLQPSGLESWGEFGPEAAVILLDSKAGSITFQHWEQTPLGLAAVFHYSVPESGSNYEVNYGCPGVTAFHAQPAYHGSIALDPNTGAILRVTLQADWKKGDPISHVASVIDYGPVDIGGRTSICPVRSLAFSVEETNVCHRDSYNRGRVQPMTLNLTTFTHYHRLASTHKFFTDVPPTQQKPQTQEPR